MLWSVGLQFPVKFETHVQERYWQGASGLIFYVILYLKKLQKKKNHKNEGRELSKGASGLRHWLEV